MEVKSQQGTNDDSISDHSMFSLFLISEAMTPKNIIHLNTLLRSSVAEDPMMYLRI